MYVLDLKWYVCVYVWEVWHLRLWAADEMKIINILSDNSNTSLVFITYVNNCLLFSNTTCVIFYVYFNVIYPDSYYSIYAASR